jgi:hypothetical protein
MAGVFTPRPPPAMADHRLRCVEALVVPDDY